MPWPKPGTGVGQHPRRRLPGARLRVHVGATLDEQLHDGRTVFADGDHQGRLLERGIPGIDDGAPVEQEPDRVDDCPTRDAVISGVSPVGSAWFGSAPTSSSMRIISALPLAAARYSGRDAVAVRAGGVGAGADQQPRGFDDRRREPASAGRACRPGPAR